MTILSNKIDFMLFVSVTNANPNGDPLSGNRPRENYEGLGEISDVCIKRKIRNRLQDFFHEKKEKETGKIFVQSDERCDDGFKSLSERAKELAKIKDKDEYAKQACSKWIDVRAFGQVFAFKDNNVSVGVRGPVSIHQAVSVNPIDIVSMQITKSVNSEPSEKKSSDTMGTKHFVSFGLYQIKGSINCQLAEKTGFSNEDAELIKEALRTLFENDSSSARPDGSMEVCKMYWWKHNKKSGQYSTAQVHRSVKIEALNDNPRSYKDYNITIDREKIQGLDLEEF
jgi:CRISPR-associated protein Csd2